MNAAANKAIVRRYFSEMIDTRSDKLIEEMWTEDCVVHRPEVSGAIKGREAFRQAFNGLVGSYSEIKTTIHNLVAENDLVVCHLSHRVVHRGETGRADLAVTPWQKVKWSSGRRLPCFAFARKKSPKNGYGVMNLECSSSSVCWHLLSKLNVRFTPKSRHLQCTSSCLLRANSRH